MKSNSLIFLAFLAINCLSLIHAAQDFDFFYFVQQWPGSYCGTKKCCFPTSGKPAADFGIHGLWPNYKDGSYPSNCDPDSLFNEKQISDLIGTMRKEWPTLACPSGDGLSFWSHEWEKHGTCSESVLDEHSYFETALKLKDQTNLLQALQSAGIEPNGNSYSIRSIKDAIRSASGKTPEIECKENSSGESQLYQIYMCVDNAGTSLIDCPVSPRGRCASQVVFPEF